MTQAGSGSIHRIMACAGIITALLIGPIAVPLTGWADDAGDAKALERLFASAQTKVFRFLMRVVKNQAVAEELLNEVFLSVWQNADRYEGRSEPMTWMLSIAHNKAISTLRKKTEVLGVVDEVARDLAAEDDAPDVAVQKQDKSAKIRAVE